MSRYYSLPHPWKAYVVGNVIQIQRQPCDPWTDINLAVAWPLIQPHIDFGKYVIPGDCEPANYASYLKEFRDGAALFRGDGVITTAGALRRMGKPESPPVPLFDSLMQRISKINNTSSRNFLKLIEETGEYAVEVEIQNGFKSPKDDTDPAADLLAEACDVFIAAAALMMSHEANLAKLISVVESKIAKWEENAKKGSIDV